MPDAKSKLTWEADNMIQVTIKINRNQDPELYALLQQSSSRSGLIRDLLRKSIKED